MITSAPIAALLLTLALTGCSTQIAPGTSNASGAGSSGNSGGSGSGGSGGPASTCSSGASTGASAYVYVSTDAPADGATPAKSQILGFSADASARLAPVSGSPFSTTGYYPYFMAGTGPILFFADGYNIDSYQVHANGCLSLENSMVAGQGNPPPDASEEPTNLYLDPAHTNLYSFDFNPPDGIQSEISSFSFNTGTGQVTQVGANVIGGTGAIAFASNDQYAVATDCGYRGENYIAEYQRGSDGALTFLNYGQSPAPPSGEVWCPAGTAADNSDHIVMELTPIQEYLTGTSQLAIYTLDDTGNLSTSSTTETMVTSQFGPASYRFSPDYRYLAASGAAGLQVFAWDSVHPSLTSIATIKSGYSCWQNATGSGCGGPSFGNVAWDQNDHLYTILDQQLLVYAVSPSGLTSAPGSPYAVQNPEWVTVLPQNAQ
jgi:hypothetical protein